MMFTAVYNFFHLYGLFTSTIFLPKEMEKDEETRLIITLTN